MRSSSNPLFYPQLIKIKMKKTLTKTNAIAGDSLTLEADEMNFLVVLLERKTKLLVKTSQNFKPGMPLKIIETGVMFGYATGREMWMEVTRFEKANVKQGETDLYWLHLKCR